MARSSRSSTDEAAQRDEPRGAFVHCFELNGDIAQRQVRIGVGNRGGQHHQSVFRCTARRGDDQSQVSQIFAHQPSDGAKQGVPQTISAQSHG
jgi:hypothetical protein